MGKYFDRNGNPKPQQPPWVSRPYGEMPDDEMMKAAIAYIARHYMDGFTDLNINFWHKRQL